MSSFLDKIIALPKLALLSSALSIITGSIAVAGAMKYLLMSNTYIPQQFDWGSLIVTSSVLFVGGSLVLVGSWLILRGRYNLGAILVLVPGIFYSMFGGMPPLLVLFTDYGSGWTGESIAFVWLVSMALPIASGALALLTQREKVVVTKAAVSKKLIYRRTSFALGLISGLSALIVAPLVAGSFPFGFFTPFLIVDGILMIYGSYCVWRKKAVRGALLILVPGFVFGFFGLSMVIDILARVLSGGHVWFFYGWGPLGACLGLAFIIASSILAIYSRE